ncbi:MAG: ABC transporter ATP-binding protein [Longispora sp.]|nr:ABC transporter ATP-binding protein [Longispora sp. (in: high G+C Gram-positive bacteria)]
MNVLEVCDLTKSYGSTVGATDVTFTVGSGEIVGLVGPNGSGKSTALHCLTGLIPVDSGTVTIAGRILTDWRSKSAFGFVPDDLPVPELLTGREYLELVASLQVTPIDWDVTRGLVEALHLNSAIDRTIDGYSHGMRRKIQLVAALMHNPPLVILDEPFRGLDPESSAILKSILRIWSRTGKACLITTHDLLVAEQMCDRIVVLRDGVIIAYGTVAGLRERTGATTFEEAFARLTGIDVAVAAAEATISTLFARVSQASS